MTTEEWLIALAALPPDGGDDVHCGFACAYVEPYGFVPYQEEHSSETSL
jgi:hypothetical protein